MPKDNQQEIIKFTSSRFGGLEVSVSSLIIIPSGFIGFPGHSRYVLLEYDEPFSWLQCVDSPDLAFVVVSGAEFGEAYISSITLPYGDHDTELKDTDEVAVVNLVSVRPSAKDTTVNLKAPLIVNLRNRHGVQLILDNPNISTRHPLWAENVSAGSAKD